MKKLLILLIALTMSIALIAGCSTPPAPSAETASPSAASTAAADASATPEASPQADADATNQPKYDNNAVVAVVDGKEIKKSKALASLNEILAQSGLNMMDPNDASYKTYMEQAKVLVLENLIKTEIALQKVKELGMDTLSAEEQKGADDEFANLQNSFGQGLVDNLKQQYANDEENLAKVEQIAEDQRKQFLANYGVQSIDEMKPLFEDNARMSKLIKSIQDKVQITDADLEAWYKTYQENQKASFEATPSGYETAVSSGEIISYIPKGMYVKHVLISLSDEDQAAIKALRQEGKDTEADAMRKEKLKSIEAKANEVLAKAKAGEDFNTLIDTYGEDPGMKKDAPTYETGYLVTSDAAFVKEFLDESLKLAKEGDITGLVGTDFGYHIIKAFKTLEEGDVAYADNKEASDTQAKTAKNQEAVVNQMNAWYDEYDKAGKIQKFPERLE